MRHLLKTAILLTALLLLMATAAQAATTTPIVTYKKGGTTSYTLNFASAAGTGDALKDATDITATGTWTSSQVGYLKGALGTGTTVDTNATLLTADLSAAVWSAAEVYQLIGLFKNCTALTTVKLPAGGAPGGATFSQVFMGCSALQSVTNLSKFTKVSSFNSTFSDCSSLESVTLSPSGSSADEVDFSAAFLNCSKLTSIVNIDKFTNVNSFSNAFSNSILTSVTLSPSGSSAAAGVNFGNAFEGCSKLTSVVNLDKFKNVRSFSRTFYYCPVLESVTLPEGSTAAKVTFLQTFYQCFKLTSVVNLDKFKNASSFSSTFESCKLLPSVTLCPEGSTVDADITFYNAFKGCKALTSIANLDKYTKASNFSETFRGCEALKDITLPVPADATKSITFQYAFSGCTALERIANLGTYKNVSSLYYAFYQCSNLTYAILGNVPSITTDAFYAVNPNCLKYMPTGTDVSTLPTDWKNVIVGGKATGDIALKDKYGSDYCPFYCPQAFSMGDYTMTYTRTWTYATKQGGWNTLCLPFAATAQKMYSAAYQNLTPAATGKDGAYLLKTLAESPNTGEVVLTNAATVEAYKPYLVALPGGDFIGASLQGASVRFVSSANATIDKTPDTQQPLEGSQYSMYGTLSDYQADNLYLLYNEKTGSTITGSSFELYADGGGVHPFRAYIKGNTSAAMSAPRLVIKGGDDGATGIREASVGASSTEVPAVSYVYSIDGRLLRTVPASEYGQRLDGLERGIYIVNGVKEVVR